MVAAITLWGRKAATAMREQGLAWLAGPVFEKDLRVSSRRGRLYVLRCAYLLALTGFLAAVWAEEAGSRGSAATAQGISRMSVLGLRVTMDILTFQFFLLPLVGAVVLSTSVIEETRRRTLEVLLTTPVSEFRVVLGKLLGGLLQTTLLLAVSLPLLVVVRVFGGVEWRWVAAAVCITLTTCLLVGSLSLLVSTWTRRAYAAVLAVALILIGLFVLHAFVLVVLALALTELRLRAELDFAFTVAAVVPNPYVAFREVMAQLAPGGSWLSAPGYLWVVHCGFALTVSAVLLWKAGGRLRKAGLPPARGSPLSSLRRTWRSAARWSRRGFEAVGSWNGAQINPVLWREIRTCIIPSRRLAWLLGIGIVGGVLLTDLGMWFSDADAVALVLLLLGALVTASLTATGIAWEKEARTLEVLLATPMTTRQILWSKAAGAIRRSWIAWAPLAVHLGLCVLFFLVHPIVLLHAALVAAGTVSILSGTGAYLSAKCSRASTAAAANVVLCAAVMGLSLVWRLGIGGWRSGALTHAVLFVTDPISQMDITLRGAAGYRLEYQWLGDTPVGWLPTTLALCTTALLWCLLGWVLLPRLAGRHLRMGDY